MQSGLALEEAFGKADEEEIKGQGQKDFHPV